MAKVYEVGEVYSDGRTPVPSYDKVKEMSQKIERLEFDNEALEMVHNELVQKTHILEKKLAIATKALEEYERCENGSYAHKALDLIKEVK